MWCCVGCCCASSRDGAYDVCLGVHCLIVPIEGMGFGFGCWSG